MRGRVVHLEAITFWSEWTETWDALRQVNIEQAVAFFTFGSQEKYRQILGAIGD
jgi:hypothetical protein